MSRPRYTCRESAEMTSTGQCSARASATAVFPTPVGPIRIRVLSSPKAALQFLTRQLNDGRPAVHIVGRQGATEQPRQKFPHRGLVESLARLDCCTTSPGLCESLQSIGPAPETTACEIRNQLAERCHRVKPWVRVRSRVQHHGTTAERLHLVSESFEEVDVNLYGVELLVGELDRLGNQQPLRRHGPTLEAGHRLLVEHPFMSGVLI